MQADLRRQAVDQGQVADTFVGGLIHREDGYRAGGRCCFRPYARR
jgi:hypothetical protein